MHIHIEYSTQVRGATGLAREQIELNDPSTLVDALRYLLGRYPKLAPWIDGSGLPRPGLLIFVNDQSPGDVAHTRLQANDHIALVTLVSGG